MSPAHPYRRRFGGEHLRALPPPAPDPPDAPAPGASVFSRGRLRGYRDLRKLDRPQLAHAAGLSPTVVAGLESGTTQPSPGDVAALAHALQITPGELCGAVDADDSWEYWDVICSHLPPLSSEQIHTAATVLRRIHRDQHNDDGGDGGEQRPHAA